MGKADDVNSDANCNKPVWTLKDGEQAEISYPGEPDVCAMDLSVNSFGSFVCQNTPDGNGGD